MIQTNEFFESLKEHLSNVTSPADDVVRGERRAKGRTFALAFVDTSDKIVERSRSLRSFQESIFGSEYFSAPNQLRWNSYVYFVAGPKSLTDPKFQVAKARIESDRHFARKFVVSEEELLERISSKGKEASLIETTDVVGEWASFLESKGLGALVRRPPKPVDIVETGRASQRRAPAASKPISGSDAGIATAKIESLKISSGSGVYVAQPFSFSDVNLIFGPNGSGKTTMLEAIEFLFCGANRRDRGAGGLTVEGTLRTPSGKPIHAEPPRDASRIKSRNLAWYRRDDAMSRRILDGFTLYNFLDTDAAFRVSTELDQQKLKEDLGRLLIGADASELWKYFGRVERDLGSRLPALKSESDAARLRIESLQIEIARLQSSPSKSNTANEAYRSAARSIGWESSLAEPVIGAEARARVESTVRAVQGARIGAGIPSLTVGEISAERTRIAAFLGRAKEFESTQADLRAKVATSRAKLSEQKSLLALLDRLVEYHQSGFPRVFERRQELEKLVAQIRRTLGSAIDFVPVNQSALSIPGAAIKASEGAKRELAECRRTVRSLEKRKSELEALTATVADLRDQLKWIAKQLIERAERVDACPLCFTSHTKEDLLSKIERAAADDSSSSLVEQEEILTAQRQRVVVLTERAEEIDQMVLLGVRLGLDPERTSLAEIAEANEAEHRRLREAEDAEASITRDIEKFFALGYTYEKYVTALGALHSRRRTEGGEIVHEELERCRAEARESIEKTSSQCQAAEAELIKGLELLALEFRRVFPGEPQPTSLVLTDSIKAMATNVLSRLDRAQAALSTSNFNSEMQLQVLEVSLKSLLELMDEAIAAEKLGSEITLKLASAQAQLKDAEVALADCNERFSRVRAAKRNISTLREKHSLEQVTSEALASTRASIGKVFSRIHAPREFELSDSDEHMLITTDHSKYHSLNDISTGQRAAFALSVFLGQSSSAASSPRVLLIDDPIAHIDDLNALSFLDYLREMSISEGRQIFFATADSRLAALFEKKFAFLGESFKRIDLPGRELSAALA